MRNDSLRLRLLRELLILDSPREQIYDDFARQLAANLDVPITLINLLDAERDWFKACVGLGLTESSSATSFCEAFFHTSVDLFIVEDTIADARFAGHPLVVGEPFIRFYAAARLSVDGQTVGTLCAYDMQPKQLSAAQLDDLRTLAQSVVGVLARRRRAPGD